METIKYNLTQAKTREDKTQWIKIGIAQKSDRNFWIKLDVLPIADKNGEVWLNLFERKDDEVQKKMSARSSRKQFTKGAMKVKGKNFTKPMRGGIRL